MGEQRVVFRMAFENLLLRALKGRVTPELKERLRAEGVDLDRKLAPGYPLEVWARCVNAAAGLVYPTLGRADAQWRLGEDFIRSYAESTLGRALFGVLKLFGPMKAVARMEQSFRSGNNFMKTSFVELGPTSAELWLSEVNERPWFNGGLLREGGRQIGAKNMRVEIIEMAGSGCRYRVSWDA
jgi:uncharacterized protein (TIGR02265 family)